MQRLFGSNKKLFRIIEFFLEDFELSFALLNCSAHILDCNAAPGGTHGLEAKVGKLRI